jgi:hypothetical protein
MKPIPKYQVKITKNNAYRINFAYKGKHYSISQAGECYEEYVRLICKEDRDFYRNITDDVDVSLIGVLPPMKHGQTYKDTDLSEIYKIIDKYIEEKPIVTKEKAIEKFMVAFFGR